MNSLKQKLALLLLVIIPGLFAQEIPLPEHPRPDFQREQWQNLNGQWDFKFDPENKGVEEQWANKDVDFDKKILVPFPWGSELSGVEDEADVAWYRRSIIVDPSWKGKRIFITIGASDWESEAWLDGRYLGKHHGGYVPFSFELTEMIEFGKEHTLVIRTDDTRREFTLYGKQGYGNARGIWQTVYLEARGQDHFDALHFTPDIDNEQVEVIAYFPEKLRRDADLEIEIQAPGKTISHSEKVPAGKHKIRFSIDIPEPRLWQLHDPFLYEVKVRINDDELNTYFGMRKISVVDLPGTEFPYIALNDEPVYMQLALDQSYHPEGFYTFPSDRFMREEIERSKAIGLNGIRTHVKIEIPRKLYWADKLGLLVMADLPNSWGEPDLAMQEESEYTLREMIKRDYNHPSIFSWVIFNETWGLFTNMGVDSEGRQKRVYLPETQAWVASMYYLAKSLDMSRLVEDNSICCGRGHTETDINSWHAYLPGFEWENHLQMITENNYPGSQFHFEEGYLQGNQPNINSECGNVWGYDGSTGDVDWSWDYHRMINSFRKFPEVAGWLYTEHHDVINEWNGYWRFDRSEKETGFGEIHEGMSLNDMHSAVYLSTGNEICRSVKAGERVDIPLFLSVFTGEKFGGELTIGYELELVNEIGEQITELSGEMSTPYTPWMQEDLPALSLTMPGKSGLACLKFSVMDQQKNVLHRNFMHFEISGGEAAKDIRTISVAPADYTSSEWSKKEWMVMDDRKVNGAGKGYFTYRVALPSDLKIKKVKDAYFIIELSAKELFVKDLQEYSRDQDFMRGSRVYPSANPNAYPMSDEEMFPSEIRILVNNEEVIVTTLPDDPADHRGVLSWHHQKRNRKLDEAGSYGYLIKIPLGKKALEEAMDTGEDNPFLEFTFQSKGEGGIAVYGKETGRYPFDPSLVLKY